MHNKNLDSAHALAINLCGFDLICGVKLKGELRDNSQILLSKVLHYLKVVIMRFLEITTFVLFSHLFFFYWIFPISLSDMLLSLKVSNFFCYHIYIYINTLFVPFYFTFKVIHKN